MKAVESTREIRGRLKQLREYLNMNKREMAHSLEMSPTAYHYVETGANNISRRTLYTLKTKHKLNENWLINGEGEMFMPEQTYQDEALHFKIEELEAELKRARKIIDKLLAADEKE